MAVALRPVAPRPGGAPTSRSPLCGPPVAGPARDGTIVAGSLGAGDDGPVGIRRVEGLGKGTHENERRRKRVLSKGVAEQARQIMSTVVSQGTGHAAAIPGMFAAGKTGTTENAGDAWFVGFNDRYTAAVWVGEGIDLIRDVAPAGEIVGRLVAETDAALARLRHGDGPGSSWPPAAGGT